MTAPMKASIIEAIVPLPITMPICGNSRPAIKPPRMPTMISPESQSASSRYCQRRTKNPARCFPEPVVRCADRLYCVSDRDWPIAAENTGRRNAILVSSRLRLRQGFGKQSTMRGYWIENNTYPPDEIAVRFHCEGRERRFHCMLRHA